VNVFAPHASVAGCFVTEMQQTWPSASLHCFAPSSHCQPASAAQAVLHAKPPPSAAQHVWPFGHAPASALAHVGPPCATLPVQVEPDELLDDPLLDDPPELLVCAPASVTIAALHRPFSQVRPARQVPFA
jgi:hypothetical protein